MDISRKKSTELSRSEELVMAALWKLPQPARRSDIQKQLAADWADTTLLSFLHRLEAKGFVRCEKQGGHNGYTALVRGQDYAARRARELLEIFCGGSMSRLLDAMEDSGYLELPALEALRNHLDTMIAENSAYGDYYDTWQG